MSRYYTHARMVEMCIAAGCKKEATFTVIDAQKGLIGYFCQTHANALAEQLNADDAG